MTLRLATAEEFAEEATNIYNTYKESKRLGLAHVVIPTYWELEEQPNGNIQISYRGALGYLFFNQEKTMKHTKESIERAIALGIHSLGLPEDIMVQIEVLMPDCQRDNPAVTQEDSEACDTCDEDFDAEEEFEDNILRFVQTIYDISEGEAAIKLYQLGQQLSDYELHGLTISDVYG